MASHPSAVSALDPTAASAPPLDAAARRRRWWALAIIALAQLVVVVDLTIVNVALPQAQAALGIPDDQRQWVITAYALAFGSLLLLGGRIADYWGRRRTFVAGLVGFAVSSAIGGVAQNGGELFAARALQGVFGALLAPAALSLLQIAFPGGRDRDRAFSVFGAVAGGGAALGSVAGGLLTEYANWRWCLLVNVPIVALTVVGALFAVDESRAHGNTRYDLPGTLLVTIGLGSLVFGLTEASVHSWGSPLTIGCIAVGVVALVAFVLVERRSSHPLLPLSVVLHRTRGGSLLTSLLAGSGLLGALLFLTFYFQVSLHYSPVRAGVASLPMTAVFVVGTFVMSRVLARFGPQHVMVFGAVVAAAGMLVLTRIGLDTPLWQVVLPGQLVLGVGLVCLFVPLSSAALLDVPEHDTGAASGALNATQQVGGAVGTALFSTIYASAVASALASRASVAAAQVHGYVVAFWWASGALGLAAVVAISLIRIDRDQVSSEHTAMV